VTLENNMTTTGLINKPSLYSDSLVKRNILRPTCCLCVCVTDDQNDWPDTALTIWSKERPNCRGVS
jgi:hypothetical protein